MAGRLANKVAIITGGAGGIGAATGLLFCQEGARVVLVDSGGEMMSAALADIRQKVSGAKIEGIVTDVADEKAAAETVAATRKAFAAIDVLVNLAGIRAYEPLAEAKRETWERILAVNLLSYAWFTKAAIGDLRARHGNIVNISSTHAANARAGGSERRNFKPPGIGFVTSA